MRLDNSTPQGIGLRFSGNGLGLEALPSGGLECGGTHATPQVKSKISLRPVWSVVSFEGGQLPKEVYTTWQLCTAVGWRCQLASSAPSNSKANTVGVKKRVTKIRGSLHEKLFCCPVVCRMMQC
jgi:hypothetical protein